MSTDRYGLGWLIVATALAIAPASGGRAAKRPGGPDLVPLDDNVGEPLLPASISRAAVEVSGRYAYLWRQSPGRHVIQFEGDFELRLGARRLTAHAAVVWMERAEWENQRYYHYDVFLWRDARLIDAAGTVTSGPTLFVTFNSYQPAEVRSDASTKESSAETELYQEASRVRKVVLATSPTATRPGEMRVVPFGKPAEQIPTEAPPLVQYRGDKQTYDPAENLATAIGDVYVTQGAVDSGDFLEIRADAAVLFLSPEEGGEAPEGEAPLTEEAPSDFELTDQLGRTVAGAYLEGNVILTRGERMIRAPRLYYDFENSRALILDAVMRGTVPERNLTIYVRAKQVRQLSSTEYVAKKAMITTSEFHTPHVHIGAERVVLVDRTPRDIGGRIAGVMAGEYEAYDTTLNVDGVPILYWPYARGDFRQTENVLRSARFGYDSEWGAIAQAKWYLFNLLGMETPEGVDAALRTDYFSDRGPGVGIDVDYERDDSYGLFRGYYIHDQGEDELGPFRSGKPDTDNRGRILLRHRQYLPDDWELTLEFSYLSDPHFLESYFESEFDEEKKQETVIYLKKQRDNWAFTLLNTWRINDFLTTTERLPDAAFHWIGEPLGEFASVFSESHVGWLRYLPDNRILFSRHRADNTSRSDLTLRGVTRNEIDFPLKLGPVNVVPYAMGRVGKWDGSPWDGSLSQAFGSVGLRSGTQFWRLFEGVSSRLLDIHDIRHIIKPEVLGWLSASNERSFNLHPFEPSVEGIDDFSGALLALRQRWQTKRGGPGNWRVVDWITWDLELGAFDDAPKWELPTGRVFASRPENSIARNHVRSDFSWRVSDTTALFADANWDLNDGNMDRFNISYAIERTPRQAWFIGYRRIHETDSNLLGIGANYRLNTKHTIALRQYYDLDRGETEKFDLTIIRRFPKWYAALTLQLDQINDNVGVSLSVWPEGVPEVAIGSKRYTGLATSTGINAETEPSPVQQP